MTINPFEIVTIRFPFSDLTKLKQRPVVVLSAPDANGDFIALAVTSNSKHENAVALTQADMSRGDLPKLSFARADKIFTLHSSLLVHKVGIINEGKAAQVKAAICGKLGCK